MLPRRVEPTMNRRKNVSCTASSHPGSVTFAAFSSLVTLVALLLGACDKDAPPAPAPPEVRVIVVEPQSAANIVELPGRVQASRTAQVRAQVDGIVQRRLYREGSDVREGQELFRIDPREMTARFNAANAVVKRAQATAANASEDANRLQKLVGQGVVSRRDYANALAQLRTAEADVNQARAQLDAAKLDLDNTVVKAPIAGRAGRAQVTEGALVNAAGATLLTTIEQIDPAYVNFSVSSSDLLRARLDIREGRLQVPELERIVVTVVLEDGRSYARTGHLDFQELGIEEATGTTALRAEFPNPDHALLPGQFVRARVNAGVRPAVLLIPQRAVTVTPAGGSVMVVGEDDVVSRRSIKLGSLAGGSWVVTEGLTPGERLIVDGLQKAQVGQPVRIAADEGEEEVEEYKEKNGDDREQ